MAAVLDRPRVQEPDSGHLRQADHREPAEPQRPGVRARAGAWLARHRATLLVLSPVLLVCGAVEAWGMYLAPERVDDEGTYVAQAYAVENFHQLAHYTYWYDHPPLGWLQMAAWTTLTDGFARVTPAVMAGREFMLVVHLVSAVLLWTLARRMDLSRAAAAGAVLVYSLSPLAVAFHRMVYLDNIAVPWLLAAFVLAAPRRREMLSFVGGAACFAVAVLTKETVLLLAPALLWWAWRHCSRSNRRYTFTVAGSLFVMMCLAYVAFAALRGELLPGAGHVSLIDGIRFQLFQRASSGSILDRTSQAWATAAIWLRYDTVLPVVATIASVLLLASRRLRPIAFAYLLQLVLLLRPGYLPVPYLIAMLPFGALAVAAVVDVAVRRGTWPRAVGVIAAVAAVAVAGPSWAGGLGKLTNQDQDRPMARAEAWLQGHATDRDRLLVDDSVWVDLVRSGLPRSNVVWYYKADTDPAVMARTPDGWRDYDYMLVSESMRRELQIEGGASAAGQYPAVAQAFKHSTLIASYGHGMDQVEIRRVDHRLVRPRGRGR